MVGKLPANQFSFPQSSSVVGLDFQLNHGRRYMSMSCQCSSQRWQPCVAGHPSPIYENAHYIDCLLVAHHFS